METLIVAVGSARRPKIDAVREALDLLAPRFLSETPFEVVSVDVPSGVRHTPLSREETMAGARQRVDALARMARDQRAPWRYFVGLEAGLDIVSQLGVRWVFLENWAYVADASGRGFFGQSGAIALPEPLVRRVVDEGRELAEAADALAGTHGIRDSQGVWGFLTRDVTSRRDAIRISVVNAFAPLLADAKR